MRVIDGDHLKSILQEYVKREEAYAESGDFFDNLFSTCVAAGLLEAIHSIEEEPPAEPDWIPCSKRLPKKSGKYYVSGGGKAWICEYLIIPNFIGGWCNDASNPVVQAWMPLPTPWKGEKIE